ncbi:MAG: hypothetical protein FD174_699 [Geobacteraceae bacterium]|nr:MAG: hypothetical protein FD174_699 [Geobacteraceae bacterium]
MPKITSRSLIAVSVAIVVAAILVVVLLDRYGRNARTYGAVGAIDSPQVVRMVVESPLDAYAFWKQQGFKGRTILLIADAWERLGIVNQADIPSARPYPLRLYHIPTTFEREKLSPANFLYVAALNGITRRVVAILSQPGYDDMAAMAQRATEARIGAGELYLPHQGFPRWFTTLARFRGEKEPVLLYVNASYFRTVEPEDLYRQLKASGVATDAVILCRGGEDNRLTNLERAKLERFARLIGIPAAKNDSPAAAPAARPRQ